jgi:hypothetical protein
MSARFYASYATSSNLNLACAKSQPMSAYGLLAEVSNGGGHLPVPGVPASVTEPVVVYRNPRSVFAGRSRRTLVAVCDRADPV